MNIFKQFIKSIYSPKDIAKFRFQGIGKTILYVFFIMLLSIIPGVIYITKLAYTVLDEGQQIITHDIPSFSIHNGTLFSKEKKPLIIVKNDLTVLFDSTGSIQENDVQKGGTVIALLKHTFIFKSDGKTQVMAYSTLENQNLNNSNIQSFLRSLQGVMWVGIPVLFIFYYLMTAAGGFIKISIFALFGLLLAIRLEKKVNYRQSWRLTAYSITLPSVFFTIMAALKTTVAGAIYIDWIITLIVMLLSIREIPSPKKTSV
ncbi:DUF1189 domain-containing protein [Heyndrickxia acidicola]|uniref:DUF1189 domain-containing protein n=1 Tax=Heyndrickxia acidicola TaxID=209389 RepID=A0ABU6MLE9_9BACI|nr:DUF1189 domain-containing protein [Heyndrickxia acidicola]MED1205124.1 DUF1189 domain-containing protein [Heyndrickxia acidicola]